MAEKVVHGEDESTGISETTELLRNLSVDDKSRSDIREHEESRSDDIREQSPGGAGGNGAADGNGADVLSVNTSRGSGGGQGQRQECQRQICEGVGGAYNQGNTNALYRPVMCIGGQRPILSMGPTPCNPNIYRAPATAALGRRNNDDDDDDAMGKTSGVFVPTGCDNGTPSVGHILIPNGKFFVIKSYTEDDVHKSIKYNVWSSTPQGNTKLDKAYRNSYFWNIRGLCPIYLFFSVNGSTKFCGLAEMVAPVDFVSSAPYWVEENKWNGQFRVRWLLVKDVPNAQFLHILLPNNHKKPVTHSRDTQEVMAEQGFQMLDIFKNYVSQTSLFDNFNLYEAREKEMQEKRKHTSDEQSQPVDQHQSQLEELHDDQLDAEEVSSHETPSPPA